MSAGRSGFSGGEREGFEPSMGLLPNRISNWTQKRDQRDLQGVLKSDAGVSRNPEALERICGSTQISTRRAVLTLRPQNQGHQSDERKVGQHTLLRRNQWFRWSHRR